MKPERTDRTEQLIGAAAAARLAASSVMLFGLGGVGGYALEALVRAGVGELWLIDFDMVSESNCNRQILALTETIGRKKTDVAARLFIAVFSASLARSTPQIRPYAAQ